MNGMDAVIQILNGAVKGFSVYADKTRGCAARLPLCASPDALHSTVKIRKSEVVPVNQGLLRCANLCAAARRRPNWTATRRFPLVPGNAGTQSGFPRAREMSERSLDCATRNPGLTARLQIKGKRNADRRLVHEPRHANECHHSPALRARRALNAARSSVGVPPRRLRQRPSRLGAARRRPGYFHERAYLGPTTGL
jgi:hypothetical protein